MQIVKYDENSFINDNFEMLALLFTDGIYVTGKITRVRKDLPIRIWILDFMDRDYYEYPKHDHPLISHYVCLD